MENKYTVLIVDDIEMNRDMLLNIFDNEYATCTAENGKVAMDILRKTDVDIVLLDLSMPVMDGYEVIAAMKAEMRFSEIPIVVTTGAAIDGSERRAFDLGADDFVVKPYDPYTVKKRVDNLVHKYVLQMENLRQALDHAEQLGRAKSDFLAQMSHEIRSPVSSIISTCSTMESSYNDPVLMKDCTGRIHDSSVYLLGVINNVIASASFGTQKPVLSRSPFDFRSMIQSIAAMYYNQCNQKNIQFSLALTDITDEYLFGDPVRLKQVFVNLISNAIKFTPAGGSIDIHVSQIARINNMVKLRFVVRNTGECPDMARLEQMWQPIGQDSLSGIYDGNGLGLSIVKHTTELMGGTVSVTSEDGVSAFAVEIPFTVARELPTMPPERLRFVKALIIDNDAETQRYARLVLSRVGIHCDIAVTGTQAMNMMDSAFAEGKGYDICFIDWHMPGMSGLDITRAIRSHFDDDTVIVVVSAYDVSEIEQEARNAGANTTVPKPMFQSTVFDLLMDITGANFVENYTVADDYNFSGRRVLLAEDNNINAEVTVELLRSVGFEVDRAENGLLACQAFEQSAPGKYDAILMDIQMPQMDGHAASRRIRASAHPQAATIPIVAVTANAFTSDIKASLAAGMNAHISKPIDAQRIYETLNKLLNGK